MKNRTEATMNKIMTILDGHPSEVQFKAKIQHVHAPAGTYWKGLSAFTKTVIISAVIVFIALLTWDWCSACTMCHKVAAL